ncbi:MAG: hypothetical protein V3R57_06380 [Candidatus Bathyarchaeia archaeon]
MGILTFPRIRSNLKSGSSVLTAPDGRKWVYVGFSIQDRLVVQLLKGSSFATFDEDKLTDWVIDKLPRKK